MKFLSNNSLIWSYAPEPRRRIRSDCNIFFLIAIVAKVLSSDVFNSDGNKSSTKSLRLDFSSRQKLLLTSFNSIAEFGLEYLVFKSLMASLTELISELVISERSLFVIGLPFKYRTASTLVTRSISDSCLVFRSD